ncbi:MAG: helix-turn-helix transcriptional regulator [Thermoanaerobacteraceae bacterium]|jgi:DNA (cytosine-5)-methyltransferase 1|nr:helix-turn-helix transcriptional regulator [Thermoanaerobacteraceae bacterium]
MAVDYSKLWKLLIDRKMNKSQLRKAAHISTNAVAKLSKNKTVSLDTLEKVCSALECGIDDIMDFVQPIQEGQDE